MALKSEIGIIQTESRGKKDPEFGENLGKRETRVEAGELYPRGPCGSLELNLKSYSKSLKNFKQERHTISSVFIKFTLAAMG